MMREKVREIYLEIYIPGFPCCDEREGSRNRSRNIYLGFPCCDEREGSRNRSRNTFQGYFQSLQQG